MKKILLLLLVVLTFQSVNAQLSKRDIIQNKSKLASKYYKDGEYGKASPLFLELYALNHSISYFENYINCFTKQGLDQEAISAIKKEMKAKPSYRHNINLGTIYKSQGKMEDSKTEYDLALSELLKKSKKAQKAFLKYGMYSDQFTSIAHDAKTNKNSVISMSNTFLSKQAFDYAEKAFLLGRICIPEEKFHYNLGNIYYYQRNYQSMMSEYLLMVKENEGRVSQIQSRLGSALRLDIDNTLRDILKNEIIGAVQKEPSVVAYGRLLIWFYVQEKDYHRAMQQAISIDRRTKKEEQLIFSYSQNLLKLNQFDQALFGVNYLQNRVPEVPFLVSIQRLKLTIEYENFVHNNSDSIVLAQSLDQQFNDAYSYIGFSDQSSEIIKQHAHLKAFYLKNISDAKAIIEKAIATPGFSSKSIDLLKTELADIALSNNELWEASYLYAQVSNRNKGNLLGDQVKLKRAMLSYYQGLFPLAQSQFDVLKASTSKFIANDAMDMSLLLTDNYNLDSIEEPLKLFAHADLLAFQNNTSEAIELYDSIHTIFPNHALEDDLLMRKAKIATNQSDFKLSIIYYENIITNYPFSNWGDEASYYLAEIYREKFNDNVNARKYYKMIITDYKGSLYTENARRAFRSMDH